MLWLLSGPLGFTLLDFFCSGIQFYLLLSPYICFISFLYLDLYVLGYDALISKRSFMQTKYLCVSIHIWTKGEVSAHLNQFKTSSKIFLLTVQRRCFFVDHLICYCMSVCWCLVVTCGKGLNSWLSFVISNCEVVTFPLVSWVRCGAWLYQFLIFALFLTLLVTRTPLSFFLKKMCTYLVNNWLLCEDYIWGFRSDHWCALGVEGQDQIYLKSICLMACHIKSPFMFWLRVLIFGTMVACGL